MVSLLSGQPSAFSAAFSMASSLPGVPELACCLASPPPVHAGVLSVILGQADRRGFQYPKGQPQETFRPNEARPRECQGKWRCYWAEKAMCYVTEAPKECDMEYSVSEWLSDLRRHKISHDNHLTYHSQQGSPYVMGKIAFTNTDYTSHVSQIEKSGLISIVRRSVASFV